MTVLLPSRHPDNASGQDLCPSLQSLRSRTGSLNRSASGQALRDDNVRRFWDSFVGANGCSPEEVAKIRWPLLSSEKNIVRCKSNETSVTRCRFTVLRALENFSHKTLL